MTYLASPRQNQMANWLLENNIRRISRRVQRFDMEVTEKFVINQARKEQFNDFIEAQALPIWRTGSEIDDVTEFQEPQPKRRQSIRNRLRKVIACTNIRSLSD